MSESPRATGAARRRGRRKRTPVGADDHSARRMVSRLPKFEILSEDDIERLHQASLAILARTGVQFNSDRALQCFRAAGARVVESRVYPDRELIESALASAPPEYRLHARNPANDVTVGGNRVTVMPGGGAAFIYDLDGRRRPGTLADLENLTRLSQSAPQIQVLARKAVEAQDIPVPVRHLECWRCVLTLGDKPVQSGFVGGRAEAEDVLEMLSIAVAAPRDLSGVPMAQPMAQCSVNVNSPLVYDTPMVESLMTFAAAGQVNLISPFVMAGVSGPTTLAGAIAQQNAELLAGLILTQLVRPGSPVLYGTASSNVDMRSGAPAIGGPEAALGTLVTAQLARRYGLPCRGGGALTDSPIPDAQSQYERAFSLLNAVLAGVNYLMHGAGIIESYLTISPEQFVIDLELVDMLGRLIRSLEITPESLALDTIDAVGPGGMFLTSPHTLSRYRDAFYMPRLSVREGYEQWQAHGAQDASERARQACRAMLADYREPPLDATVKARLDDFVLRRRRELKCPR